MKTFKQLQEAVPENVVFDRGFRLVDAVMHSGDGRKLKDAIVERNSAKAELILRLHSKVDKEIREAHKCIFKTDKDTFASK